MYTIPTIPRFFVQNLFQDMDIRLGSEDHFLVLSQANGLSIESSIFFYAESNYYFTECIYDLKHFGNNYYRIDDILFVIPPHTISEELADFLITKFRRLITQNKGTYLSKTNQSRYQKAEYHGVDLSTVDDPHITGEQYIIDYTFQQNFFDEMWSDIACLKRESGFN